MSKTTQKMLQGEPLKKIFRLPSPYWQYLIHVAFEKYPYDQQRQLVKKTEKCLLKKFTRDQQKYFYQKHNPLPRDIISNKLLASIDEVKQRNPL